ncbi:MAG: DUF7352 domain-containing protein [Rhodoglobus sp.]
MTDRSVWKYEAPLADEINFTAPGAGAVLHAVIREGVVTAWVDVRPDLPPVAIRLAVRGTGHPSPDPWLYRHVATCIDGPFVGHVYVKDAR